MLIALGAYAAPHVVAWLLPAWRQLGIEALARVQRKLRDATGRMLLLTLPSFVIDVPALPRGRRMRPSPVFRTSRIAMLLNGIYSTGHLDRSAGLWRVSPRPRRRPYRQTRRRRPLPTPPPLAALLLAPFFPASYPPPLSLYSSGTWIGKQQKSSATPEFLLLSAARAVGRCLKGEHRPCGR